MPTLQESTSYENLAATYEPVQQMDKPAPPTQTYPAQPNTYLRATVPQIGIAGPDSQRSYFNGGKVPQIRIPVLNQLGSPFN